MPAVMSMMAEANGTDIPTLVKQMEKGQVKSDTVIEFARIASERARQGGALEKAIKLSSSEQYRFNNSFTKFIEVMGKAGLEKGMAATFSSLTTMLESSKPLAEAMAGSFKDMAYEVEDIVMFLSGSGETALGRALGEENTNKVREGFGSIFTLFKEMSKLVGTIYDGWMLIFGLFDSKEGVILRIASSLEAAAKAVETINKLIAGDFKGAGENLKVVGEKIVTLNPVVALTTAPLGNRKGLLDSEESKANAEQLMSNMHNAWNPSNTNNWGTTNKPTPQIKTGDINLNLNVNTQDTTGLDTYLREQLPLRIKEAQQESYSLLLPEYQNK